MITSEQYRNVCIDLVKYLEQYVKEDNTEQENKQKAIEVLNQAKQLLDPGPSLLQKALAGDKECARQFLFEAGIIDKNGELKPIYQSIKE